MKGSLSRTAVQRVLDAHRADILRVYRAAFAGRSQKRGTVSLRFFITATGAVIQAKVESGSLSDSALERALAKLARSWRFDSPSDGAPVEVRYQLRF